MVAERHKCSQQSLTATAATCALPGMIYSYIYIATLTVLPVTCITLAASHLHGACKAPKQVPAAANTMTLQVTSTVDPYLQRTSVTSSKHTDLQQLVVHARLPSRS